MQALEVPVYDMKGEKVGTVSLTSSVFGVRWNNALVHQVVEAQRSQSRSVLAHTKGRGEVRGGGKKPWRQKGTGRARHGSIRSPLWSGGGVTFGPTKERNFAKRINRKMRTAALCMVLSDKVTHGRLIVVDAWSLAAPKTKEFAGIMKKLPVSGKKTTVVTSAQDTAVIRAARNLPYIKSLGLGSLNVVDVLAREYVVMPKQAVEAIEKRFQKV